ncbi:thioredoxin domain-containing protein [Entomobacter blattae]|uniref:Thioredoxin n=1 Tax=Entomobacter blattae TaxID=2762277 RepID=A0A7H1NTG4_9PROT|nr:thioredoxin domain-containing protein [Entomobacter blattae]QNT79074.1 Thioredoxin [Entomobacter blattae]
MSINRRLFLATTGFLTASNIFSLWPAGANTLASASTLPEIAFGSKEAEVVVEEWYSLTCIHCAKFSSDTFPKVKSQLIDTGKIRYVFKEFPLDKVALTASMVALSLPEKHYLPFISLLLSTQDKWVFKRDVNPEEELKRMAILAGMSGEEFDKTIHNTALQEAILNEQNKAEKDYKIDSTPSFRFFSTKTKKTSFTRGELTYDEFLKQFKSVQ